MSLTPNKRFGQHFLRNQQVIDSIAEAVISLESQAEQVLEVGPGEGVMTVPLLGHFGERYHAAEIDTRLQDHLLNSFPLKPGQLLKGDFLKMDIAAHFSGSLLLVGNFPYNISSQIVFKMLDHKQQIPAMVGMFQKEMAQRIAAPPGSKAYGVISVLAQAYYKVTYLFDVPPASFYPPPKVDSGVIKLERFRIEIPDCDERLFRQVVKTAFNQRRKMLRNSLKGIIGDRETISDSILQERPEQLSVDDFIKLTQQLSKP